MEIYEILKEAFTKELGMMVISNARKAEEALGEKIKIRPVLLKDEVKFQVTFYQSPKVIHKN